MQIPKRLAYVLERDQALDGAVKLSMSQFEPWIKHSNLPFFPEYTKHDIEHIEAVLLTATSLIRDEAWESITPGDAAVLVLAVLLHDCAMHLSEDGFAFLLSEGRREKAVEGMADPPWHILWEDFYGEASRFDGRKLHRLFGDTQPVRRPPLNPNEMTKKDRLLIGEFLRRHHPRLAQEIAFFGVPTTGEKSLVLEGLSGSAIHIAGLSGIVARSHGANVRAYLPYLQAHFDIRQFKGAHPVFLMTLLRVADYVQIQAERAPAQVLLVRKLASPASQGEWKAHHAIKDVRHTHEDPEALFVDAFPEDINTFFRVQSWLRGIQEELDASWAVLGEVYGRYEGLNRLGLILRRVRSTIDDPRAFSKRVAYLPVKAAFRGSDPDLLKLLIEPLYGKHPEVGFRELIQNAVDAVRELEHYWEEVPDVRNVPQPLQESDVLVTVENGTAGEAWVTVSDKGIGMSEKTIIDYFLTAGASFRRSEDWRKMFETSGGKSKVLRAGRFGVGALATFLVGPEIEVSTRHADESEGIQFKACIEGDTIELRRINRPVGTTIRIRISDSLGEQLGEAGKRYAQAPVNHIDWDWYCLTRPSLVRTVFGAELAQKHRLPACDRELPAEWRKISHPDYTGVLWTYSSAPVLVCNGIDIRLQRAYEGPIPEAKWGERFGLKLPNVCVFDPDGRLPLNLQRTGLAEPRYPFDETLFNEVVRDFVAFSLVFGPTTMPDNEEVLAYAGSSRRANGWSGGERGDWYFTRSGFGFLDASVLHGHGGGSFLVAILDGTGSALETLRESVSGPTIVLPHDSFRNSYLWKDYLRHIIDYAVDAHGWPKSLHQTIEGWRCGGEGILHLLKRRGGRLLVSESFWNRLVEQNIIGKRRQRLLMAQWKGAGWCLLQTGNCPETEFDFENFARCAQAADGDRSVILEYYLDRSVKPEASPVASKWLEILHSAEIPYDLNLRREKLKHAYETLSAYVRAHEATRKQKDRKR
jgi:molecular chaperone HtpG